MFPFHTSPFCNVPAYYVAFQCSGRINLAVQREICSPTLQQATGILQQATRTLQQVTGTLQQETNLYQQATEVAGTARTSGENVQRVVGEALKKLYMG